MKLMLTSDGFTTKKLFNEFVKLVGKPTKEIKMVIVPTAAKYKKDYRPLMVRDFLVELGLQKKNTKILEIDHKISYTDIDGFDVVLVGGGNSYLLLDYVRKSGFDKVLAKFNGTYVGVSAGSILAAPDIKIAKLADSNTINLRNLSALGYADFAVAPHMDVPKFMEHGLTRENVQAFAKTIPYDVIPLTDRQAVIVINGKRRLIE